MTATAKWPAAAGFPTPARHNKLLTSVESLTLLPLRTTIILLEAVVSGLLKNPTNEWRRHYSDFDSKTTLAGVCEITLTFL